MKTSWMLLTVALLATGAVAEDDAKWRIEPLGNDESIEFRVLRLGLNGGAVGGYVEMAEYVTDEASEVYAAGFVGTYTVVKDAAIPIADLFPRFLGLEALLPETIEADIYLGARVGVTGLDVHGDVKREPTAGILAGITFGPLALEGERIFGRDVWNELADVEDDWQARIGIPFKF